MSAWHWLGVVLLVLAITLELVDRLHKPIGWWRVVRGPVAGLLAGMWAMLIFRKTPKPQGRRRPEPVEPKEYDDDTATKNKQDALDTDVDAAGDAARRPSTHDLQSELDNL